MIDDVTCIENIAQLMTILKMEIEKILVGDLEI